jgi:hypothetical protein
MALHGTLTGSQMFIDGSVTSDFVVIIDNGESTAGHGLKVTSDGVGTDTNAFDVETGSTTHMRVRGDGRIGMGKVTSFPQAKLTIDGSGVGGDNADLSIAGKVMHLGDSNTHFTFPNNDEIMLTVGGESIFNGYTEAEGTTVLILSGGSGDSIDPAEYSDVNFFVSGAVGSRGQAGSKGAALFAGDMCISGTLHITGSDVADVASKSATFIGHGGRPVTGAPAAVSASSSGVTISAAAIVGANGIMATGRASGQSDTTDTAANIIAQIPLPSPGLQIDFVYMNLSSNSVTLAGGSGVTMANASAASFAIAAGKGRAFRFAINQGLASVMLLPVSDSYNLNS